MTLTYKFLFNFPLAVRLLTADTYIVVFMLMKLALHTARPLKSHSYIYNKCAFISYIFARVRGAFLAQPRSRESCANSNCGVPKKNNEEIKLLVSIAHHTKRIKRVSFLNFLSRFFTLILGGVPKF